MIKHYLFFLLLLAISVKSFSQHQHDHNHANWELGVGIGIAPIVDEGSPLSAHLHLLKSFDKLERFQFGVGLEHLFDEHQHTSVGLVINYNLFKDLFVGISPGLLFTKHESELETNFVTHFELHYEFNLNGIHIGPLFEYAISREDKHFMIGLHLGLAF